MDFFEEMLDLDSERILVVALALFVFVISFVGNLLIIIVMVKEPKLRSTPTSSYIVSIAFFDIASSCYNSLFLTYQVYVREVGEVFGKFFAILH
jgi:hypothetical protein